MTSPVAVLAAIALGASVCYAHVLPPVPAGVVSSGELNTNASSPANGTAAGGAARDGAPSFYEATTGSSCDNIIQPKGYTAESILTVAKGKGLKSTRCTMGQNSGETTVTEPFGPVTDPTCSDEAVTTPGEHTTSPSPPPSDATDDPDCSTTPGAGGGGGGDHNDEPVTAGTTSEYIPPPRLPGAAFFYVDDS